MSAYPEWAQRRDFEHALHAFQRAAARMGELWQDAIPPDVLGDTYSAGAMLPSFDELAALIQGWQIQEKTAMPDQPVTVLQPFARTHAMSRAPGAGLFDLLDLLPDPDTVGSAEYRAIHETVAETLEESQHMSDQQQLMLARSVLGEFETHARDALARLPRYAPPSPDERHDVVRFLHGLGVAAAIEHPGVVHIVTRANITIATGMESWAYGTYSWGFPSEPTPTSFGRFNPQNLEGDRNTSFIAEEWARVVKRIEDADLSR